jgi:predicted site-specific integrase-resolvase
MTIIIEGQRHFTLAFAAPKMGYSLATLRNYAKNGVVPTIKVGGRRYVAESTITKHLEGK